MRGEGKWGDGRSFIPTPRMTALGLLAVLAMGLEVGLGCGVEGWVGLG